MNEIIVEDYRKRKKKNIIVLGILILLLGVGYAFLQTTLSISGTSKVKENNWNIYWDNLRVKDGSVIIDPSDQSSSAAEIDNDKKTTVSFTVSLEKPGDYYEFMVDAVNDGTVDAMVSEVSIKIDGGEPISDYLDYTVTYEDGVPIVQKQILGSSESNNNRETYKFRVEYKKDILSSDLPDDPISLSCTFEVTYLQADQTAIPVREIVYSVSDVSIVVGQPIPSGVETFDNPGDSNSMIVLKHVLTDGKVALSYLGAASGEDYHFLQSGHDSYIANKQLVNSIFEPGECIENSADGTPFLSSNAYHQFYRCSSAFISFELLFDNQDEIYYAGNESFACVIKDHDSICGDGGQVDSFVLGQ